MENFIQTNLVEIISSIISGVIVAIIHTLYVNKNSNISNIVESVNNISKQGKEEINSNNITIQNENINFNSSDNLQIGNNNFQDNSNTLNNIQYNQSNTINNNSSISGAESDGLEAFFWGIFILIICGILITIFNKVLLEYSTIFYFLIIPPLIISIGYLYSRFAKNMAKRTFLFPLLVIVTSFIFLYNPLDQGSYDILTEILNELDWSLIFDDFGNVFSKFLENIELMSVFLITHLVRLATVIMFITTSIDIYMKKNLEGNTQFYLLLNLIIMLFILLFVPQFIFSN